MAMTRNEIEGRLLDYLMNEVTPVERAEIDAALAQDAGLCATLEELRGAVGAISAAKAGSDRLSSARREALLADAAQVSVSARRSWGWFRPAALAASGLLWMGAGAMGGAWGQLKWGEPRVEVKESAVASMSGAERASGRGVHGDPVPNPMTVMTVEGVKGQPSNDPSQGYVAGPKAKLAEVERSGKDLKRIAAGDRAGGRVLRSRRDFPGPKIELADGEVEESIRSYERSSEEYSRIVDNPFLAALRDPLSTFSIDVDTAAYANMRRFIHEGSLPPADAVRIEEMVNYFRYEYAQPVGDAPFSVAMEVHAAPWEPKHRLLRIGLQGKEIDVSEAPPANLVFLIDVSGSMSSEDRLPLVKKSLTMLAENLRAHDKVSMVVYAGKSGLVLPPTGGDKKEAILEALNRLSSGGSTNGAQGIELAYRTAAESFVQGGVNRVILCTDGDFNVGVSSEGELTRLIEEKRKTGVFLSVLGFGRGNYADARMQALADKGNGNASYIDSLQEAKKVLVEQATGTLITIAKDVKIQVEFNPGKVAAYRLIGYENRMLAAQDFNDDKKDAGEIGAGHQVTALYEIVPAGEAVPAADVDELRYQKPPQPVAGANPDEMCTVKLRYKAPDGDVSRKVEFPFADPGRIDATPEFDFAASVAMVGMLLRDSEYKGQSKWELAVELAKGGLGNDKEGWRKEFVELVEKAKGIEVKK
jgi:Ca-activated chloride channel family protein